MSKSAINGSEGHKTRSFSIAAAGFTRGSLATPCTFLACCKNCFASCRTNPMCGRFDYFLLMASDDTCIWKLSEMGYRYRVLIPLVLVMVTLEIVYVAHLDKENVVSVRPYLTGQQHRHLNTWENDFETARTWNENVCILSCYLQTDVR